MIKLADFRIKHRTIAHWERMYKWVETQDCNELVNPELMLEFIGESWGSIHCPFCKKYLNFFNCGDCPVGERYGYCGNPDNENAWCRLSIAKTWKEWLIRAKLMIIQIKSL